MKKNFFEPYHHRELKIIDSLSLSLPLSNYIQRWLQIIDHPTFYGVEYVIIIFLNLYFHNFPLRFIVDPPI